MIPYLEQEIAKVFTLDAQQAIVREYLQMRILQSLQRAGAMIPLAFHGGTALRLLYNLPRFSVTAQSSRRLCSATNPKLITWIVKSSTSSCV